MKFRFFIVIILIIQFGFLGVGLAQSNTNADSSENKNTNFFRQFDWITSNQPNIHEFNFIGGYSFHSSEGFWGKVPGATLSIYTLRYNRKFLNFRKKHVLEYVAEINLSANYDLISTARYRAGSFSGFGTTPLGFQFNWHNKKLIQPFIKSSTGFMWFNNRFPDERGTKFNFTLELGTGIEFVVLDNLSFTVGYKYHHISNFFLGDINPGVDSNIFYTGITIF